MAWSERQRLMLQQMGIRLWAPVAHDAGAALPTPQVQPPQGPPTQTRQAQTPQDQVRQTQPSQTQPPQAQPPQAQPLTQPSQAQPPQKPPPQPATLPQPSSLQPAVAVLAPAATPLAPETRAAAIAAMPWPELRAAVAACTACALCQSRRQTVFGVGHAQAHWMIVGEAPGEQEDLKGEPFVGPAGQLLDNMLRALNLTRSVAPPERQVYIANALKCRPPRNRNPEPQEMASCEPYLLRQIELVRPRLILAMGRFAVQALLRSSEPVGKLRGRVHRYHGVPLVVTYHPAYLLRSLGEKARAWDDLCLAAQIVDAASS